MKRPFLVMVSLAGLFSVRAWAQMSPEQAYKRLAARQQAATQPNTQPATKPTTQPTFAGALHQLSQSMDRVLEKDPQDTSALNVLVDAYIGKSYLCSGTSVGVTDQVPGQRTGQAELLRFNLMPAETADRLWRQYAAAVKGRYDGQIAALEERHRNQHTRLPYGANDDDVFEQNLRNLNESRREDLKKAASLRPPALSVSLYVLVPESMKREKVIHGHVTIATIHYVTKDWSWSGATIRYVNHFDVLGELAGE